MRRAILSWLRILVGLGILAVLVWRLGTGAFVAGLRVVNAWSVVAALALGLLTMVLSGWRWSLVARRLGLRLPLRTAVADYYRALFLNTVLPGGVLGDVHRAVRHGQDSGDVARGVRAVVIERAGGQIVLVATGAVVFLAQPAIARPVVRTILTPIAAVALAVAICALLVAVQRGRGTALWRRLVTPAVTDVRLGLLARDTWPGVMTASAATLAGHIALFFVAARVAGAGASFARLLPLMVLALLAMGLPVNVGGWGPREGVCAWAFAAAGLGADLGLTVAVVYGVLTFIGSLPGAGVLAFRHLTRPRSVPTEAEDHPVAADEPARRVA
jgi:uncharacterized membrane protein YbhN (UPF0104 family)